MDDTCPMCGCLIGDRQRHYYWHSNLAGSIDSGWIKMPKVTMADLKEWAYG